MRLACFFGAIAGVNALYASDDVLIQAPTKPLTALNMETAGAWDYRLDNRERLWLAYYDQDRLLRLRDPGGEERLLVPEGRTQAPSGIAMTALETGVGLLWRDKLPTKGLYLLDTNQPTMDPLEVGGDTEPLARFRVVAGKGDLLHLFWLGEKTGQFTGEKNNLYYRNWNRNTQALSPIELLMPGIYPVMSTDTAGGVMAYSWVTSGDSPRIVARYRPADTQNDASAGGFGDPVTIAEVPEIAPIFDTFRSGSRWFVVWMAQYGMDRREFQLEGAHSDDQGKTWKRFAFEDLRGVDIGSLQIAADDAGHILLALTGRTRDDDAKTKQDVFVIRSSDQGDSWSTAHRLRDNTARDGEQGDRQATSMKGFHARNPSIAFGEEPGQVLVVWEDWRDIRSGLYASLSNDYGLTWALSNVPLPRVPGENLGLRYEPNAAYASDKGFRVIAEKPTNDSFEAKQLIHLSFNADDLAGYAKSAELTKNLDAKSHEEALRKRADGLWQAMVAGDYEKTYEYQDPFFRARMAPLTYLSNMGKIKYTHAQVDSIRIDGPKAEVITTIRAHVPAFKVPSTGEVISQPEREVAATNTWLWLDGEWYREFQIESQDIVFTRY